MGLVLYAFFQVVTAEHLSKVIMPFYKRFVGDWQSIFADTPLAALPQYQLDHMFALFFQIGKLD